MKGQLIVIDGIDGSGKTTQTASLTKYLTDKNIPHEVISFPRYGHNRYTNMVKDYLSGKFGGLYQVDPYFVAQAYAGDRLLAKPKIVSWLKNGKLVIANRYISSSIAHLGANLPENKRGDFFKWLKKLEYETHGMPKEDLTILLAVDSKLGQKNVQKEQKTDIHEQNLEHLQQASKIYLKLAKSNPRWYVVDCSNHGQMKTKEVIHQDIMKILQKYLDEN